MSTFEYRGLQRLSSTYYRPVTRLGPVPQDQSGQNGARLQRPDASERVYPVPMSRATRSTYAPRQPTPNYRPWTLRKPFLVGLITVILGIIAAMSAAYRRLPPEVNRTLVPGSEAKSPGRAKDESSSSTHARPKLPRRALETLNTTQSSLITTSPISAKRSSRPGPSQPSSSMAISNTPTASSSSGKTELPAETGSSVASIAPTTSHPITSSFLPGPIQSGEPVIGQSGDESGETRTFSFIEFPATVTVPFLGSAGDFGNDGKWTKTETVAQAPKQTASTRSQVPIGIPQDHHANDGPVPITEPWQPIDATRSQETVITETGVETVSQVIPMTRLTTFNDLVSQVTRTRTAENGIPTLVIEPTTITGSVSSIIEQSTSHILAPFTRVQTLTNDNNIIYVLPQISTLLDANGRPTATTTRTPYLPISTPTTITLTNSLGLPTTTLTTSALATPLITTLTNPSNGLPTSTATVYPLPIPTTTPPNKDDNPNNTPPNYTTIIRVYSISKGQYFIGFFLPPLLSALLSIPIRMLDLSAKRLQPFHELASASPHHGVSAANSLCLKVDGIHGLLTGLRGLTRRQPLVFLTTMLSVCVLLLVPLSAEAIAPKLHGACSKVNFEGCAMTLGVFRGPARGMLGVLGVMVVLLVVILGLLGRWRSGVPADPWTLAGVASLAGNREVRGLFEGLASGRRGERVERGEMLRVLGGRRFRLGWFAERQGAVPEYGIVCCEEEGGGGGMRGRWRGVKRSDTSLTVGSVSGSDSDGARAPPVKPRNKDKHHLPFLMLSFTSRISFLVLITGVMVVTLYYNKTGGDTPFERFMGRQSLGVRAMFTMIGVAMTLFWCSFFTGLATLSPYRHLSHGPQPASKSILLAPPMTAFTGIFTALKQRDLFLALVALTAILSEFMPILLNNVPFKVTQTWVTHLVCTWMSIGIMGLMWLVILGSFFVKWPHMPADPSTIAGTMFYVFDSRMLLSMEGMSLLDKKDRDRRVGGLGLKFEFGIMMGLSGRKRTGVDAVHDQTV